MYVVTVYVKEARFPRLRDTLSMPPDDSDDVVLTEQLTQGCKHVFS
jgi:hypothetical protein